MSKKNSPTLVDRILDALKHVGKMVNPAAPAPVPVTVPVRNTPHKR